MDRVQSFAIVLSLTLLISIFQLIRKNKLLEQYALLWIASVVILLVLSIWRDLLDRIAALVGIFYPPSALFFIAILCGMVIALHFSVVISKLTKQNHILAQEVALLRQHVEELKKG